MLLIKKNTLWRRTVTYAVIINLVGLPLPALSSEDHEDLTQASKVLTQRFLSSAAVLPLDDTTPDLARIEGRWGEPHLLTQSQARKILGVDSYGQSLVPKKLPILHQHFTIQHPTLEKPLPLTEALSHSTFHRLMTGDDSILPSAVFILKNVHIKRPQAMGPYNVTYYKKPIDYIFMVSPHYPQTLQTLLMSPTWNRELIASSAEALICSSLVASPIEAFAENFLVTATEEETHLLLKPNLLSSSSLSYNKNNGRHYLEAKNSLYFIISLMERPINEALKTHLLSLNPEISVLKWLAFLNEEEKDHEAFLTRVGLSSSHYIECGLPLRVTPGLSQSLVSSLTSFQKALATASTYQQLFETFQPLTATFYKQLNQRHGLTPWKTLEEMRGSLTSSPKSLEDTIDLTQPLIAGPAQGKRLFEVLAQETFPAANHFLSQSLASASYTVLKHISLVNQTPIIQRKILTYLAYTFPDLALKRHQNDPWLSPLYLNHLLFEIRDPTALAFLFKLGADPLSLHPETRHALLHHHINHITPDTQQQGKAVLETLLDGGASFVTKSSDIKTIFDVTLERRLDSIFTTLITNIAKKWKPSQVITIHDQLLLQRYRQWKQEGQEPILGQTFDTLCQISPTSAWALAWEDIFPALPALEITYESLSEIVHTRVEDEDDKDFLESVLKKRKPLQDIQKKIEKLLGLSLNDLQVIGETLEGALMGTRQLLPGISEHLFNVDGSFKRMNIHGRRNVANVSVHGRTLYMKRLPELPGYEYAMYLLHQRIIGHGIPPCDLIKMRGEAYLVSLGIDGQNVADFFKNNEGILPDLESESFSRLLLMTMLTNPEDAKSDNFILAPLSHNDSLFHLVSVDNDHALLPTQIRREEEGRMQSVLQVKSLLYCLDQMKEEVIESVRQLFYKLDPYMLLKDWLHTLQEVDKRYKVLFTEEEATKLTQQECVVGIPFTTRMIAQLYNKLVNLQLLLIPSKKQPLIPLTHQNLLNKLEPILGIRYIKGFDQPRTVADRFAYINKRFYETNEEGDLLSKSTSSSLLRSLDIPIGESLITAYRRGGALTLEGALEELEAIRLTKDQEVLLDAKGLLTFQNIRSQNAKETFLERFNFKTLSLAQQQTFLRLLKEADLRRLTFRNCEALTQDILFNTIGVGNLTRLHIETQDQLSDNFIEALQNHTAQLRTLILINLSQLYKVEGDFPALEFVILKGCTSLQKIILPTSPLLYKLAATHCDQLETLQITSSHLHILDVTHNALLNDKTLDIVLQAHPHLKHLKVQGSPHISYHAIREVAPYYCISLLQDVNENTIVAITKALTEKNLQKLDLGWNNIRSAGAQALAGVLPASLQTLNLTGNNIEDAGAQALAGAITASLETLDLTGNNIGDAGAQALAKALPASLQTLDLRENNIGPAGVQALAETLPASLKMLYLTRNNIGDEGAKALAKALPVSLQTLNLGHNNIGDEGARALAQPGTLPASLRTLDLRVNKISDEGAEALGQPGILPVNLQRMNLKGNNRIQSDLLEKINNIIRVQKCSSSKIEKPFKPIATKKNILFQGNIDDNSFLLIPTDSLLTGLLDGLTLNRGLGIHQLFQAADTSVHEAIALDIQKAFWNHHLPSFMNTEQVAGFYHETKQQHLPHFEERLHDWANDSLIYYTYIRFVLGSEEPLHPLYHAESIKQMAQFQGLSYVIWKKDQGDSLRLDLQDIFLSLPPIQHILMETTAEGESYRLLKYNEGDEESLFPKLEDEIRVFPFPWLESEDVLFNQGVSSSLFNVDLLETLSPDLKTILRPLTSLTHSLTCLPKSLTGEESGQLGHVLLDNQTLKQVMVPACDMDDAGAEHWAHFLENNTSLTFLSLVRNAITERGMVGLQHALQANKTIVDIRLKNNPGYNDFYEEAFKSLLSRNKGIQYGQYIKTKHLSEIDIPNIGIEGTRFLLSNIEQNDYIRRIQLGFTSLADSHSMKALTTFLENSPSLTLLSLVHMFLTDETLNTLIEPLKNLSHLRSLDLRGNSLQDSSIISLLDQTTNLHELDLRWIPLDEVMLERLALAFQNHGSLKSLMVDFRDNSPAYGHIQALNEARKIEAGLSLLSLASMRRKGNNPPHRLVLRHQTTRVTLNLVRGDGDCGYSALGLTREEAATHLHDSLNQPVIRTILATEIRDNFDTLPAPLHTEAYLILKRRQEDISAGTHDRQKRRCIDDINQLLNLSDTDRLTATSLMATYFRRSLYFNEQAQQKMYEFLTFIRQEEALEDDIKVFCEREDTLQSYITHYIQPTAVEYYNRYGNLNWLSYSPFVTHGHYRLSVADALARIMGCNLAIWTPEGLSHEYYWDEDVQTLHLWYTNGNHFDTLMPRM